MERWGLRDAGFNYNIVAVFGSQSTGKSAYYAERPSILADRRSGTLLNRLFGTTFDVMDETRRQQTTKGAQGRDVPRLRANTPQVSGCAAQKR